MIPRKHQIEGLDAINRYDEGIIHLPTGAGKTFIEELAIVNNIDKAYLWLRSKNRPSDVPVFVILAPRILLSNQLYNEIKEENNIDCQYLIVHSGKTQDRNYRENTLDRPFRELKSTTSTTDIIDEYKKAKSEHVPLIIIGTYDSSERIVKSNIPVYMLLCDEAQYLVSNEFGWIPLENEKSDIKQFNAHRKYYFTATLKETNSDKGMGMNNTKLFGPIIYMKTPQDMIVAGEIVRPRMHLVDVKLKGENISELDIDVISIIDSFREHTIHCNIRAKVLVVTKGSKHLNDLVTHPKMQNLLKIRPSLQIFDISSRHKPRINGKVVRREEFLERIKALTDDDEAIIFHVNILTEGIDVPGITGIMPMNMMVLSKFLQTLGRVSRLHKIDRTELYDGTKTYDELEKFVKQYAWIIIPIYGVIGQDLKERITEIIRDLRSYGFNAAEDVVIQHNRGTGLPQTLETLNKLDTRGKALFDIFLNIEHEIEKEEVANELKLKEYRMEEYMDDKTFDEILEMFENG